MNRTRPPQDGGDFAAYDGHGRQPGAAANQKHARNRRQRRRARARRRFRLARLHAYV